MVRGTIITPVVLVLLLISSLAGSIGHSYALGPPPPGAYIYLEPESQDISALGSAVYNLTIDIFRYGPWEGWVNLKLGELPEGVTAKMIDAIYIQLEERTVKTPIYVTVTPFVNTSQITISVTAESNVHDEHKITSTQAQLNVVSSVTTSTVTQRYTKTLADKTLTVTVLSTTTSTATVSTTMTDTQTVVDNNAIIPEIRTLLESGNDSIQTISIGVGIAISGVTIAIALRKRK